MCLPDAPRGENEAFTLNEVRKVRTDAIYGKKSHFNAADRKRGYHWWTGIPAAIITLLLGSCFMEVVNSSYPTACKWLASGLSVIAATLIMLQTMLRFERNAQQHQRIGSRYLAIVKECRRVVAYHQDGDISPDELRLQLESLAEKYEQVNRDSDACPPSKADYRKAREGWQGGEESYTEAELNDT
jgi:hypothetical protein